jgi:hypothetical protein
VPLAKAATCVGANIIRCLSGALTYIQAFYVIVRKIHSESKRLK